MIVRPYRTSAEIAEIAEGILYKECENQEAECILCAYDCLDSERKKAIDALANRLVRLVGNCNPLEFNFWDAVYFLGKLGMFMVRK